MHNVSGAFVDLCLGGKVRPTNIDEFVEAWHLGGSKKSIWDFLGLTPEEYTRWVEQPESINAVIEARRSAWVTGSAP